MKVFFSLPFLLIYGLLATVWLIHAGRRRAAMGSLLIFALGLYLLCTPMMTRMLMRAVGEYPPEIHPETWRERGAQMIVVLGGGQYRSPETGADAVSAGYSLGRIRYAAIVSRRSGLPVAVTGAETEAPAMASALRQDYAIRVAYVESASHTTAENAEYSARLLLPAGIRRIALVTDVWHMGRAARVFRHFGFDVLPAPTGFPLALLDQPVPLWMPRAELFLQNLFGLSEVIGQVKYRFSYRTSPTPVPATSAAPAPGSGNPH